MSEFSQSYDDRALPDHVTIEHGALDFPCAPFSIVYAGTRN